MIVDILAEEFKLKKANYRDSGFDLQALNGCKIKPFKWKLIPTGIKIDMRNLNEKILENSNSVKFSDAWGVEAHIRSRSGNALNRGLFVLNSPGTGDQYYTGYIGVILFNASDKIANIKKGDKIAQLVFVPVLNNIEINYVDEIEEQVGTRGDKGFGSSDKEGELEIITQRRTEKHKSEYHENHILEELKEDELENGRKGFIPTNMDEINEYFDKDNKRLKS